MTIGRIYVTASDLEYSVSTAAERKNIYHWEDGIETLFQLHNMTFNGTTEASAYESDHLRLFEVVKPMSNRKKRGNTIQFSRAF